MRNLWKPSAGMVKSCPMGTATIGRAVEWTDEVRNEVIERITAGESIRSIFEDERLPARSTFYLLCARDPAFETAITRARRSGTLKQFDEFVELADTADKDNYNAIKTRLWARTWALARLNPDLADKPQVTNVTAQFGVQLVHSVPQPAIDAEIVKPSLPEPE